ncbi:MAG: hypothetical protein ACI89U_002592 [Gammaproteobacteria bacterium]|jgi:hypothetical protein
MSSRGTVIARYKARTNAEGASAWAEVQCAPSIRMHVPKFEITAVEAEEIDSIFFGLISAAGIQQEWVKIHEHGLYVTCFLHQTDGTDECDAVEMFLFDELGRVADIWAI